MNDLLREHAFFEKLARERDIADEAYSCILLAQIELSDLCFGETFARDLLVRLPFVLFELVLAAVEQQPLERHRRLSVHHLGNLELLAQPTAQLGVHRSPLALLQSFVEDLPDQLLQ